MQNPTFWDGALHFAEKVVPWLVSLAGFWKCVDAVMKYMSDGRDARTRSIVKDEIEPLSKEIKELSQSIFKLANKI